MEFLQFSKSVILANIGAIFIYLVFRVIYSFWVLPNMAHRKLKTNGFGGPTPSFPLGNTSEMEKKKKKSNITSPSSSSNPIISHDIHSSTFPYFAQWQKNHGNY